MRAVGDVVYADGASSSDDGVSPPSVSILSTARVSGPADAAGASIVALRTRVGGGANAVREAWYIDGVLRTRVGLSAGADGGADVCRR